MRPFSPYQCLSCNHRFWWSALVVLLLFLPFAATAQESIPELADTAPTVKLQSNAAGPQEVANAARRQRFEPQLQLVTGGPTATLDILRFTPDGKELLAAGEDKVLRFWSYQGRQLQLPLARTLRWPALRQQRGAIYASAFSPDPDASLVAVAGYGFFPGVIVVLNRQTGEVVAGLAQPARADNSLKEGADEVIWSLAFHPNGRELVYGTDRGWLRAWKFQATQPDEVRLIGRFPQPPAFPLTNRVLALQWRGDELLAISRAGQLFRWWPDQPTQEGQPLFQCQFARHLRSVSFSADGQQLLVSGERLLETNPNAGFVEHIQLARDQVKSEVIWLPTNHISQRVQFAPSGKRFAIATFDITGLSQDQEYITLPTGLVLGELNQRPAQTAMGFSTSHQVDQLTFSPDEQQLVVAGGDHFEITVWDLDFAAQPIRASKSQEVVGAGRCVWQVAFTSNNQMAFRNGRDPAPKSRNQPGAGEWRFFDLFDQRWLPAKAAAPVQLPLESLHGWSVQVNLNPRYWLVYHEPTKTRQPIPWDREQWEYLQCFSFVPGSPDQPTRLVVGHMWGASLFELNPGQAPVLKRTFVGHQGFVSCLAVNETGTLLLTGGRDQTIACWSLADWPHQGELGAAFEVAGEQLLVTAVAPGSPAWEAGLTAGDRITFFAHSAQPVPGGPTAWQQILHNPPSNQECYFEFANGQKALTTLKQRPLWQFFATAATADHQGEWILWRWRDYFYNTSFRGDHYLGWQLNRAVAESPLFYPAEKFRSRFHQPHRVAALIQNATTAPERIELTAMLPPELIISTPRIDLTGKENHIVVELELRPRPGYPEAKIRELALWINGYKLPLPEGQQRWEVPRALLRTGANTLLAHAYTEEGTRDNSNTLQVFNPEPRRPASLTAVVVGINRYGNVLTIQRDDTTMPAPLAESAPTATPTQAEPPKTGPNTETTAAPSITTLTLNGSQAPPTTKSREVDVRGAFGDLTFPVEDAQELGNLLASFNRSPLYQSARVHRLLEEEATLQRLSEVFAQLQRELGPDDRLVLFLAGHGDISHFPSPYKPNSFVFICSNYHERFGDQTGLSATWLQNQLSQLPAQKLVLIDACHAGAAVDLVRTLLPEGIGPVVMTAVDEYEESHEVSNIHHGLFSKALLDAFDPDNRHQVDANQDQQLSLAELYDYVHHRVQQLFDIYKLKIQASNPNSSGQTPRMFPENAADIIYRWPD